MAIREVRLMPESTRGVSGSGYAPGYQPTNNPKWMMVGSRSKPPAVMHACRPDMPMRLITEGAPDCRISIQDGTLVATCTLCDTSTAVHIGSSPHP